MKKKCGPPPKKKEKKNTGVESKAIIVRDQEGLTTRILH